MLSMPPAITTEASPIRMSRRANITACRPEPQTLFTVTAPTLTGRPALITAWRAGLAHAGRQHVADERALDFRAVDPRALHRFFHGDRAELGGGETRERALE